MKRLVLVLSVVVAAAIVWIARPDQRASVVVVDAPPAGAPDPESPADAPGMAAGEDVPPASEETVQGGGGAAADPADGDAADPAMEPPAQADAATEILERTAKRYQGITSMRADFVLSVDNPLLRRTSTSRGTLAQKRPDKLLLDFSDPDGDVIVSDGTHIWVYYPSADARQVIRTAAGTGAGGVDLQAQFIGDPVRRFEHTLEGRESVGGRPADVLALRPREDAGYRELRIWIDRGDGLIRRFQITELNGAVRRFDLSSLEVNVPLDDARFRFTPPADARIIER